MISLPFNGPVKLYVRNGVYEFRDPSNKTIAPPIVQQTFAIDSTKKTLIFCKLLEDLLNGIKSVSYNPNTKGYELMHHAEAPQAGPTFSLPGTIQAAEQASMEKTLAEMNGKVSVVEKVQEVAKAVAAEVKRRGRPKGWKKK